MTREEIINEINCLLSELDNGDDAVSYLTQNDVNWLKENIKALEQEPILEKDGTLVVTTKHYKNVGRVLVQYGTNGSLFYQDQEPSKPMVGIDLYSVIKQKYIEREVLDKIRAEIEQLRPNLRPEQMTDYDYAMVDAVNDIVAIIDKYKAKSEE